MLARTALLARPLRLLRPQVVRVVAPVPMQGGWRPLFPGARVSALPTPPLSTPTPPLSTPTPPLASALLAAARSRTLVGMMVSRTLTTVPRRALHTRPPFGRPPSPDSRAFFPRVSPGLLVVVGAVLVFGLPGVLLLLVVVLLSLLALAAGAALMAARTSPAVLLALLQQRSGGLGGFLHRHAQGLAERAVRAGMLLALREQRSARHLVDVLQRGIRRSPTVQAAVGTRNPVLAPPATLATIRVGAGGVFAGLPPLGVGAAGGRTMVEMVCPVLDERAMQRGLLRVTVEVETDPGSGGGGLASPGGLPAGASVWETVRHVFSGKVLAGKEETASSSSRPSGRLRPRRRAADEDGDGGGAGAGAGGESLEDLLAEDEAGRGPLRDETYAFRVVTCDLVVPGRGAGAVDLLGELGGTLRSGDAGNDDERESPRWSSRSSSRSSRTARAPWEDVVGARGREVDAEWTEGPPAQPPRTRGGDGGR
jgi:hypothetical protein